MSNSTTIAKPQKPYSDFPLFPHATRRWAKKIRGKLHYFGPWDDPDAALQRYLDERDDLHAGRKPRSNRDGLTVRDLVNRFLTAKQSLVDAGELQPRSFTDYHRAAAAVVEKFGRTRHVDDLKPDDFADLRAALAKRLGPTRLANDIQRVRSIFKFAFDNGLIDRPMRFGSEFKRPAKRLMREARYANEARSFTAAELRKIIDKAGVPVKAMILLGVNCGFGQQDCSDLEQPHLDLRRGYVTFPRKKTGIRRRAKLWPETVKALREAIAARPDAAKADDDKAVFLTYFGRRWVRVDPPRSPNAKLSAVPVDSIAQEFNKIQEALKVYRKGRSFYALRRTFRTVADDLGDKRAIDLVMGHGDHSMADHYVERVGDDRLVRIADHVRKWLFGTRQNRSKTTKKKSR